jgi:hypothetical protein
LKKRGKEKREKKEFFHFLPFYIFKPPAFFQYGIAKLTFFPSFKPRSAPDKSDSPPDKSSSPADKTVKK